jgi:hypothetical protein
MLVLAAMFVMADVLPALAQEPNVAQGQLMTVDATTMNFVIRTESGSQMSFSYTKDTKVNGVDETAASLGTLTGKQVTVQYEKQENMLRATQIDVQKTDTKKAS